MMPDHEKNALINMLQEAIGREIHLRAALGEACARIAALEEAAKKTASPD